MQEHEKTGYYYVWSDDGEEALVYYADRGEFHIMRKDGPTGVVVDKEHALEFARLLVEALS